MSDIEMLTFELQLAENLVTAVGNDLEDAREAFEAIKMRHESALEYRNEVTRQLIEAMRAAEGQN